MVKFFTVVQLIMFKFDINFLAGAMVRLFCSKALDFKAFASVVKIYFNIRI